MLPHDYSTTRVKRIIIVEDDEMIAGIYKRKFEAVGFKVQVVLDGSEGYYQIFKNPPDALLLDLMLPGMDGVDIIRKFRAQRNFSELPIIVFTNAYLTDASREAVRAGANRVFNKATVMPREVIDAVRSALELPQMPTAAVPAAATPNPAEPKQESVLFGIQTESPFSAEPSRIAEPSRTPAPPLSQPNLKLSENPTVQKSQPLVRTLDFKEPQAGPSVPAAPEPPVAADAGDSDNAEEALQILVNDFLEKSGAWIQAMRNILRQLQAEKRGTPQGEVFVEISRLAHLMSSNAAIVGFNHLAQIAAALEALAWELFDHPSRYGFPTLQTFAKAIDMIAQLSACGASRELKEFSQFHVLVLDDDPIVRKMISKTLDRAKLPHVVIGRPELAMELLAENAFDLFILDVKMDGASGFEVCATLRKMPRHSRCRVIFVSSANDLRSKMNSIGVGGNEFIVKPFAPMELALKALLHMVAAQLDKGRDECKPRPA